MVKFLYRRSNKQGDFEPVGPQECDADNLKFFDMEYVSEKTGLTIESLEKRWLAMYGEYTPKPKPDKPEPKTIDQMIEAEAESLLLFAVDEHVYRTFVTVEPLVDLDGRPAAGRCIYNGKLILINSHFPPATWEETWFHEVAHAKENHYPKPEDEEKGREWETTHARSAAKQYEAQDGLKTLMSLKPLVGIAPSHVCKTGRAVDRDLLIRRKFAHLSEYQFDVAKSLWEEYKLNPRFNHFKVHVNEGDVQLVPTLHGLMSLIMYAPGFVTNPARVFEMPERGRIPLACTSTAKRIIDGVEKEFSARVTWVDQFGDDSEQAKPVNGQYPQDSLGARSDVRAIRMAYADVIGNLGIEEEQQKGPRLARDAARTWPDFRRGR